MISVIPVWKEPIPGWTDNINGPAGLLIGAGKGVIRTMYCKSDGYADFLPVDIGVNGMLACTFDFVTYRYIIKNQTNSIFHPSHRKIVARIIFCFIKKHNHCFKVLKLNRVN